jgi:DNA repair protein RecN (Recombination protein N)
VQHLRDLGMEGPQVEIRLAPIEPGPNGADRPEIWFASDQHLDSAPVGVGASGGELSRLVLAVRLAARGQRGTTLVFDEIDTGIGGATALAMGRKLAELARDCQVICVTHLPQVAAFADAHHVVTRDGATANAALVTGEERVREVTRMLAGLPESIAGHQAATELLSMGGG